MARVFVILIGFNQCGFGLNPGTSWCTWFAFAALKQDGTVEAWGNANYGGGHVPSGLSGVIAIYSTEQGAFAALKEDGTVEVWGSVSEGGDNSFASTLSDVSIVFGTTMHRGLSIYPDVYQF